MTRSRIRLLAALATGVGVLAGGYEANVAPQIDGWWHGITGTPSLTLVLVSLGAAALVWLLGSVTSVRRFLWMSAGLLPIIPALTGSAPALLLFSGYTTALLFAILLALSVRGLTPSVPWLEPIPAFLISFAFFVFVGRYLPGPAGPQGDEPHYLLIAESLLRDGDVDLKNQFDERAYSKFTSAELEPHTAPRSPKDKLYAIHTPGLSALILPGYALLGFTGARVVVSGVMAMVVSLLVFASKSIFGTPSSLFVFVLATFASPLPIYANAVFPDSVATLPVALTLACMLRAHTALLGLTSASIAALPWLHPRFVPLGFLLALAISMSGEFSWRRVTAAFVPLLISVGLLLLHFQSLFGSASLSAAYGPGFASDVSIAHIPWGGAALLLDRQFGLLLFSPVLLVGLSGLFETWTRNRQIAALIALLFGMLLAIGGSFSMWWGGASAPARFLIAATPALLLAAGAAYAASQKRPDRRSLLAITTGFGSGLLFLTCLAPRTLHNRADGESGLLRLLAPALDLDRFFPGFVNGTIDVSIAALWGAVVVAAIVRPKVALGLLILPFAVASFASSKPLLDPFSSSLRVLEAWNDHRRAFVGQDSRESFSLEVPLGNSPWDLTPGVQLYSPRFSLPRGAWTLLVESQAVATPEATNVARVSLVGDDEAAPFAAVTVKIGESTARESFILENDERRVRLRGDGLQSRASIVKVRFIPGSR